MKVGHITEHFSWEEAHGGDAANAAVMEHDPRAMAAIPVLCSTILEPIRAKFGQVSVHSMYRSPAKNAATPGSSSTSQHMKGEACDFHCPSASCAEVARWIANESGLPFGQVIAETRHADGVPSWVHVSLGEPFRASGNRQALYYNGHAYTALAGYKGA